MSQFDVTALLDSTVDDLADLPVFAPKPEGTYKAQFSWEIDSSGDVPYFKFTFKLLEILSLNDPSKAEEVDFSKEPKITVFAYPITKEGKKNEFGEGTIKMIVNGLRETHGGNSNGETLANAQGSIVGATFKIRRQKDKETKEIRENNELVAVVAVDE